MNERWEPWIAVLLVAGLLAAARVEVQRAVPPPPGAPTESTFPVLGRDGTQFVGGLEWYQEENSFLAVSGLGTLEKDYRHAYGPVTELNVSTLRERARVFFRYYNGCPDQTMTITFDDQTLERMEHVPLGELERSFQVTLKPGTIGRFRIAYELYNHHGADPAPDDQRPLAGTFFVLGVTLE